MPALGHVQPLVSHQTLLRAPDPAPLPPPLRPECRHGYFSRAQCSPHMRLSPAWRAPRQIRSRTQTCRDRG
eukprot:1153372-Pleurochrysis_carterae.AAC.1